MDPIAEEEEEEQEEEQVKVDNDVEMSEPEDAPLVGPLGDTGPSTPAADAMDLDQDVTHTRTTTKRAASQSPQKDAETELKHMAKHSRTESGIVSLCCLCFLFVC